MADHFDRLIINAKPQVPSPAATLAAVRARPVSPGPTFVGAAAWVLRAAALFVLAAGVGALAAWLPRSGVGTPAAGNDLTVASLNERAGVLEELARLERKVASVEAARREQLDALIDAAVREALSQKQLRERERWQERHIAYVRRRYAREMEERLTELNEQGLDGERHARAREILEQHGLQAVALIRHTYNRADRRDGFALLARETEERLQRLTGEDQWQDILGTEPEHWGPSPDFEDWTDFDSHMHWMRQTSRG